MLRLVLSSVCVLGLATSALALQATLDWSGYTDTSVTKYTIVRDDVSQPVEVTVKTYTDTTVQENQQYCWTVTAVNASGKTPFSKVCGLHLPLPQGYDGMTVTFTK